MPTKIEWTEETWNPVTGCTPISEGCQNCYAKRMAKRLAGRCGYPKDEPFKVTLHLDKLKQPLKWKKPRRIFVCSMGDLFHNDVPINWLQEVFDVMWVNKHHTFLILTKRPDKVLKYIEIAKKLNYWAVLPNVWLGVTAENQQRADERIPILLQIPAAKRFVSVEPMLGPLDLTNIRFDKWTVMNLLEGCGITNRPGYMGQSLPNVHCNKIDWVICGSESGPNHRKTKIEWIRDLREQCISANVPFFLKQMEINGRMVKMPELDGKIWAQFPEVQYAS
jgi:protein gp37